MENTEELKLQWIKGDKMGTVETVVGTEGEWTIFESGGRVSTGLIGEFLSPIDGEPLDFTPSQITVPQTIPVQDNAPTVSTNASSPIRTLFDKQKKNDKIKLTLSFPIEVPKEAIYEIISSSFDLDEVNDELESFIVDQISDGFVKDSLMESIKELISTRYKID